jgi:hypothetical protein
MIQLCAALHHACILNDAAITRIKDAVAREIALSGRGILETEFRRDADAGALFAGRDELRRYSAVGLANAATLAVN